MGSRADSPPDRKSGPPFAWSTRSHIARRLYEWLAWYWIADRVAPRRAREAAYNVAGALAGIDPDSIRKLAYTPSKRSEDHEPRPAPRTGLDRAVSIAADLSDAEAKHLREHGAAIEEMLAVDLRDLATEIGRSSFEERLGCAANEAKKAGLALPPLIQRFTELPTDTTN